MPEFGYSDRKGYEYLQPLFWAINDQSDVTFYAHYMSECGVRAGIEYRYVLSENTIGALFVEGYTDKRIDDGSQEAVDKWGYGNDEVTRPMMIDIGYG